MNYKIIQNEKQLNLYTDLVLPQGADVPASAYCVLTLKVRNKYAKRVGIDIREKELRSILLPANAEEFRNEIATWECPLGAYKSHGISVPNEALTVYAMPNYRIQITCVKSLILQLQEISWRTEQNKLDLTNLIMSHTVKGQHSRRFLDFDIDTLDFDLSILPTLVNMEAVSVIRTRGGFHVLVEQQKVSKSFSDKFVKNFFPYVDKQSKKIKLANGQEMVKEKIITDCLLPVPGTIQGTDENGNLFSPHFIIYNGKISVQK